MGQKFAQWESRSAVMPSDLKALEAMIRDHRGRRLEPDLQYGDHGLEEAATAIEAAIRAGRRIALYADYDVDGTMSCVSWIWFFRAIGFDNFLHYIPCRFTEGYGLNMEAVRHLIEDKGADLIITMDTGITANDEAAFCKERGVQFICTDHHKVQPEKMPDCIVLNPKMHPDEEFQELCGCGITFVLLRRLAKTFPVAPEVWTDLLALTGMATICDVVPLNSVNHRLARQGVQALMRSQRKVLRELTGATKQKTKLDEQDVGFRLGPRINAVGRLQHADAVIRAFIGDDPGDLIHYMEECNERRRRIQAKIVEEAIAAAEGFEDESILFLGGDWHPGVVGIAASKLAETFWKPVWLFQRGEDGVCKGSARSIPGFDVTLAMMEAKHHFTKFGGHAAAGGFSFATKDEGAIRTALSEHARVMRHAQPALWTSRLAYDCELDPVFVEGSLTRMLDGLKPFGHGFEEPKFRINVEISRLQYFHDKVSGKPRHTALFFVIPGKGEQKVLFFQEVLPDSLPRKQVALVVTIAKNHFRGTVSTELYGCDWDLPS